jgi:hypothetical protein
VTGNGKRAGETDICLKMRNKDEYKKISYGVVWDEKGFFKIS